jgi:hypothetical protein
MEAPPERTMVYVKLLDEGTDAWRPVLAEDLGQRRYRLLPTDDYDPVGAPVTEWDPTAGPRRPSEGVRL